LSVEDRCGCKRPDGLSQGSAARLAGLVASRLSWAGSTAAGMAPR